MFSRNWTVHHGVRKARYQASRQTSLVIHKAFLFLAGSSAEKENENKQKREKKKKMKGRKKIKVIDDVISVFNSFELRRAITMSWKSCKQLKRSRSFAERNKRGFSLKRKISFHFIINPTCLQSLVWFLSGSELF